MSVTVTVHSGELKRIRQLIAKKDKPSHGQLYGLWTHSNQPVIQYVIGDPKSGEVERFLWENHALRQVGCWSTEQFEDDGTKSGNSPLSFVNMTVELLNNGKEMNVKLIVFEGKSKLDGALETLEGHSAFRLTSPFSDDQKRLSQNYHKAPDNEDLDVKDISEKPSCEAETNQEQWYSTEEGMQLFGKIHGALQGKFEINGTSRDTKTHDLCVSLKYQGKAFSVDFPVNFPEGLAVLTAGKRKAKIHLAKTVNEEEKPKASNRKNASRSNKDKPENAAGEAGPQEYVDDPEKIPQLLVQEIYHMVVGTNV